MLECFQAAVAVVIRRDKRLENGNRQLQFSIFIPNIYTETKTDRSLFCFGLVLLFFFFVHLKDLIAMGHV